VEYVRTVDFAAFEASATRVTQPLLDRDSATSCQINCIKTPAGDGSPAGLRRQRADRPPGDQHPLARPQRAVRDDRL
jgi:hypothetical protein